MMKTTISAASVCAALIAGIPEVAFASGKPATRLPAAKTVCKPGSVCLGKCNAANWCNIVVCGSRGRRTPTLGFCLAGTPACPRRC